MEYMNDAALGMSLAAPDQRSCKELGVCQSRKLACADCPQIHFAPGVIDFGSQRSSMQWAVARRADAAWGLLKWLVIALAVAGSLTFTACLLAAKWGWL
jgi:hypothetical protein